MPTGTSRKTKTVDGILYQQCTKCEEWLPATKEYFQYRKDQGVLHTRCRICLRTIVRLRSQTKEARAKQKAYREANRIKMMEYLKNWRKENQEYIDSYVEKNKAHITKRRKDYYYKNKDYYRKHNTKYMASNAKFKIYKDKLTIDEDPKEGKNGKLLIKCTYCGRYFNPTNRAVLNRISVLNGGENLHGEARLYCSENCKISCPVFGQQLYYKGQKHQANREVDPLVRQMALELDNYECQRCGKSIDEVPLHVHHILTYKKNPIFGNDVGNNITFCIDCHLGWMHSKDGYGCIDTKCEK